MPTKKPTDALDDLDIKHNDFNLGRHFAEILDLAVRSYFGCADDDAEEAVIAAMLAHVLVTRGGDDSDLQEAVEDIGKKASKLLPIVRQ